jgi:hypothetical protein
MPTYLPNVLDSRSSDAPSLNPPTTLSAALILRKTTRIPDRRNDRSHNLRVVSSDPGRSTWICWIKIRLPQGYRESRGRETLAFFVSAPGFATSWRFGARVGRTVPLSGAISTDRTRVALSGGFRSKLSIVSASLGDRVIGSCERSGFPISHGCDR